MVQLFVSAGDRLCYRMPITKWIRDSSVSSVACNVRFGNVKFPLNLELSHVTYHAITCDSSWSSVASHRVVPEGRGVRRGQMIGNESCDNLL